MSDQEQETSPQPDDDMAAFAVSDGAWALFVADFDDEDDAYNAYLELKRAAESPLLDIKSVLVVKRSLSGEVEVQKVSDDSTTRGLAIGVLGGVLLGILFPPSVLGSAVVLGAAGAGLGKLREVSRREELEDDLSDTIVPGHSGLIALVNDPSAPAVMSSLDRANRVVQRGMDKAMADKVGQEMSAADPDSTAG